MNRSTVSQQGKNGTRYSVRVTGTPEKEADEIFKFRNYSSVFSKVTTNGHKCEAQMNTNSRKMVLKGNSNSPLEIGIRCQSSVVSGENFLGTRRAFQTLCNNDASCVISQEMVSDKILVTI